MESPALLRRVIATENGTQVFEQEQLIIADPHQKIIRMGGNPLLLLLLLLLPSSMLLLLLLQPILLIRMERKPLRYRLRQQQRE